MINLKGYEAILCQQALQIPLLWFFSNKLQIVVIIAFSYIPT